MIYTVHIDKNAKPSQGDETGESRFDGAVAIPEGVAKWALIFPPLWLTYHRLWWVLLVYVMVFILSLALMATAFYPAVILLASLPGLYLFLEGHQLRRAAVEANDYELIGLADARDGETAIAKVLNDYRVPLAKANPTPTKLPVQNKPIAPAFGMFSNGNG